MKKRSFEMRILVFVLTVLVVVLASQMLSARRAEASFSISDGENAITWLDYESMPLNRQVAKIVVFKSYKPGDNLLEWKKDAYATSYRLYFYLEETNEIVAAYQQDGEATDFSLYFLMSIVSRKGLPSKGYGCIITANQGEQILSMDCIHNIDVSTDVMQIR